MYLPFNHKHILLLILVIGIGCKSDTTTETAKTYPTPYTVTVPAGFPPLEVSASNPLTEEGVLLGKMLYSDSILSTNTRRCTSCHNPIYSYSSPTFTSWAGTKFSVPPHINLGFKKTFNWDGSEESLDTLAMGDFEPEFFNTNPTLLVQKLKAHPVYPDLFNKAFGIADVGQITYTELKRRIANAIAQYLRTRVSANSKFDKYRRKQVLLTQNEYEGYVIFYSEKGDCFHCHSEPLYTDQQYHNNGVSETYTGFDLGRQNITHKDEDKGKFFTPTLRNIELTAPYMHDGRLATLEDVVNFYSEGVSADSYVDPLMTKKNGLRQLNLTPLEKMQLVAFLKTLTDLDYMK
ncbi:MAG: cytochrome-c peroxidase [Bacteroidetes bacterium B1(2017)]|nr:MAG: cytochrome-c peroxidase [Bacteroidetes bacterium B1(2017)]